MVTHTSRFEVTPTVGLLANDLIVLSYPLFSFAPTNLEMGENQIIIRNESDNAEKIQ